MSLFFSYFSCYKFIKALYYPAKRDWVGSGSAFAQAKEQSRKNFLKGTEFYNRIHCKYTGIKGFVGTYNDYSGRHLFAMARKRYKRRGRLFADRQ